MRSNHHIKTSLIMHKHTYRLQVTCCINSASAVQIRLNNNYEENDLHRLYMQEGKKKKKG